MAGAWVASYPMDYVKTQLQADDCTSLREGGAGPRYRKNKLLLDGGNTFTTAFFFYKSELECEARKQRAHYSYVLLKSPPPFRVL